MYNASRVKNTCVLHEKQMASKVKVIGVSLSNPLIFKQVLILKDYRECPVNLCSQQSKNSHFHQNAAAKVYP